MTKAKIYPKNTAQTVKAAAAAAAPDVTTPRGKLGALVMLMLRPDGASLEAMQAATGWQAHSVRGAIAGSIKKKLAFAVTSEKTEGGRIYRIVKGGGA